MVVYSWYRVGEHYTSNPYVAKFYEIVEMLTFSDLGSAKIVVAVSTGERDIQADAELNAFLAIALPEIETALAAVTESSR